MARRLISATLISRFALCILAAWTFTNAVAAPVQFTVNGVYRDTGANASPTDTFSLSFTVSSDMAPICGGGLDVSVVCSSDVSLPHYVNGPLNTFLGAPSLLLRDPAAGGGLVIGSNDVALNRLQFQLAADQLFTGPLNSPTLIFGTFALTPNDICPTFCGYRTFASQGFAVGDPVSNPFFDPITLQAVDPILSGTITIAPLAAIPEPTTSAMLLMGMTLLGMARRRRPQSPQH